MKKITVEMTSPQASVLVDALILALLVPGRPPRYRKTLAVVSGRLADAIEAAFPKESK